MTVTVDYLNYLVFQPDRLGPEGKIQEQDKSDPSILPHMHVVQSPRWNLATGEGRLHGAVGLLSLRMYLDEHGRGGL